MVADAPAKTFAYFARRCKDSQSAYYTIQPSVMCGEILWRYLWRMVEMMLPPSFPSRPSACSVIDFLMKGQQRIAGRTWHRLSKLRGCLYSCLRLSSKEQGAYLIQWRIKAAKMKVTEMSYYFLQRAIEHDLAKLWLHKMNLQTPQSRLDCTMPVPFQLLKWVS